MVRCFRWTRRERAAGLLCGSCCAWLILQRVLSRLLRSRCCELPSLHVVAWLVCADVGAVISAPTSFPHPLLVRLAAPATDAGFGGCSWLSALRLNELAWSFLVGFAGSSESVVR